MPVGYGGLGWEVKQYGLMKPHKMKIIEITLLPFNAHQAYLSLCNDPFKLLRILCNNIIVQN